MTGPLFIIGGHEDKEGDRAILRAVAAELAGTKLVIATVASRKPEGYLESYAEGFRGIADLELVELYIDDAAEALDAASLALLDGAAGVFFSGGDQKRLVARIAGTPIETRLRELWHAGGVIAGTSAGASALGETMIVRGPGDETYRTGELETGAGLALVPGTIIDQHFAERGRIGRLLGAVRSHPAMLGIGIDENTAIRVHNGSFDVLGEGSVYFVDARSATSSGSSRGDSLTFTGVRLDVLADGDGYDLQNRTSSGA